MKDYEKFYTEVEEVSADVSALINVLGLFYKVMQYSQNGNRLEDCAKFCDWMHTINRYAGEVQLEMKEMLKKNM